MYKWPLRTDVLSCWKPYLCFVAYLAFLSLVPGFSHTTVGGQGSELFASNRCYLYLQFIACFFVVLTAASLFEETFRTTSRQYIRTLPLGTVRVILARYIKLLLFVLIPYVPTVLFMFIRANASLQDYFLLFPQESACPPIPLLFPLVHCVIAVNFYIIGTMFLMFILQSKVIALIIIMIYCAMEAAMLHFIFPRFVVFCGAFNIPDFYHIFPTNIQILAVVSVVMLAFILLFYKSRHSWKKFCRTVDFLTFLSFADNN